MTKTNNKNYRVYKIAVIEVRMWSDTRLNNEYRVKQEAMCSLHSYILLIVDVKTVSIDILSYQQRQRQRWLLEA